MGNTETLLKVQDLSISFNRVPTLYSISFTLKRNSILGIVGEKK